MLTGIENDITYDEAYAAHLGMSMSPERRAEQTIAGHIDYMRGTLAELEKLADTDEKRAILLDMFPRFRAGVVKRKKKMLAADSRVMSVMISGGSNYPTRSQEKKKGYAHNALNDLVEYEKYMTEKIKAKMRSTMTVRDSDADALDKLAIELEKLEAVQDRMKKANRIARSKTKTGDQKREALESTGMLRGSIHKFLRPDYGRPGFQSFELASNNSKIKRVKERIASIERKRSMKFNDKEFPGGVVHHNVELDRLQILFDDKPDEATRAILKKNGFRWSPKNEAWQRQLTRNAQYAAVRVIEEIE